MADNSTNEDIENMIQSSTQCKNRITKIKREPICSPGSEHVRKYIAIQQEEDSHLDINNLAQISEDEKSPVIESKIRLNIRYPKLYEYLQNPNLDTLFTTDNKNGNPVTLHKYNLRVICEHDRIIFAKVCGIFIENAYCKERDMKKLPQASNNVCALFRCSSIPNTTITDYLVHLVKYTKCSNISILLMAITIQVVLRHYPSLPVNILTIHRLVLASLLIATKFVDEDYDGNLLFAKLSQLSLREMNSLEAELLFLINFNLHYQLDAYNQAYYFIVGSVSEINPELVKELKTKPQITSFTSSSSISTSSSSSSTSSSLISTTSSSSSTSSSFLNSSTSISSTTTTSTSLVSSLSITFTSSISSTSITSSSASSSVITPICSISYSSVISSSSTTSTSLPITPISISVPLSLNVSPSFVSPSDVSPSFLTLSPILSSYPLLLLKM